MTVAADMHAMPEPHPFDEVIPSTQRFGVAMWSRLHEGERVLIFKIRPHDEYTLCVLYAEPLLQLSDQEIGQLIVELIGLEYSDDQPADYVTRGGQLRAALSDLPEPDGVVFMYFHLQFLTGPHPPSLEYLRPE